MDMTSEIQFIDKSVVLVLKQNISLERWTLGPIPDKRTLFSGLSKKVSYSEIIPKVGLTEACVCFWDTSVLRLSALYLISQTSLMNLLLLDSHYKYSQNGNIIFNK